MANGEKTFVFEWNTVQKKMPGFNQNVGVNFGGLFCCFALQQLVVFLKFV